MAALETAAHAHQTDANPETVSRAMTMTAPRLTAPKTTTLRYPDISSGPHTATTYSVTGDSKAGDTDDMVDDTARDRAIYHALKAVDEVAAALQTHLIEQHGADPERAAAQSSSSNSLKLLRQARERLGEGLRAVKAEGIAESDAISLRNQ
jgi:hypothetical protein